ncbi:UNVERIFIED_CONTAM: hypothetical protein Sradi_5260000 [Sesamum radiatum]|uniref:Uncharacterized protein n=1 Tax=Sesamum radiatum TaxID=300843 RepID=A0AAW2LLH5_SESRA
MVGRTRGWKGEASKGTKMVMSVRSVEAAAAAPAVMSWNSKVSRIMAKQGVTSGRGGECKERGVGAKKAASVPAVVADQNFTVIKDEGAA